MCNPDDELLLGGKKKIQYFPDESTLYTVSHDSMGNSIEEYSV